jgi:hypothetical protein
MSASFGLFLLIFFVLAAVTFGMPFMTAILLFLLYRANG